MAHDLGRIGSILVDLNAGMAALKAVNHQLHTRTVYRSALQRQTNGASGAAGAGYGKNALILTINVDKGAAFQHRKIDPGCAFHAGFFIHGDHDL